MVAILESRARAKQANIKNSSSRMSTSSSTVDQKYSKKGPLDALTKTLLQNKSLEAQIAKLKLDVREACGQRDAMKSYISGLESALVNLQRKFSDASYTQIKPSQEQFPIASTDEETVITEKTAVKVETEAIDAYSLHFRTIFMQKAFKSLLCTRDAISIRRHAEVMCSLLQYSESERAQIIASIDRLTPFLCALGTYEYFF
jgi:hypothetical protein